MIFDWLKLLILRRQSLRDMPFLKHFRHILYYYICEHLLNEATKFYNE